MTSDLFKGLLAGGLVVAMVGCSGGEEPTKPAETTSTETQPEQPAVQPQEQPAEPAVTEPAGDTQETPEGTMSMFLGAMKEGDYDTVLALSDATSIGYEKLKTFADSLIIENPDERQQAGIEMVRSFMLKPWQNVASEAVTIRDERAKFLLTYANAKTLELDLIKSEDGLWMVFLPERFLEAGIDPTSAPSGQAG